MTDKSKPGTRSLWVTLLYNWDTREKTLSLLDDAGPLFAQIRKPGDHLYRAEFEIHPPGDDGSTTMEFKYVREEWETQEPKGADTTTEAYIARRAFLSLSSGLVPPFSFSPGEPLLASNYPGQHFTDFTLSGVKYRLTVERVGP